MDKEMIKFIISMFLLFPLSSVSSFSQELYTKVLKWDFIDSTAKLSFKDKEKILGWSKSELSFSHVMSKDLSIKNQNVYILMVDGCSGIACWKIYIFKEEKEFWELIAVSNARLIEQIQIEVDYSMGKIYFKTKSGLIGDVSFLDLGLNSKD